MLSTKRWIFTFVNTSKGGDSWIGALGLVQTHKGGHDLGPVAHLHFFEDVVEMGFYGHFTYVQLMRDALIGQTQKKKRDDLLFPFREGIIQL